MHNTPPEYLIAKMFSPPFEGWKVNSYKFGQKCLYPNEAGEMVYWGVHAGADTNCFAGTEIRPIAPGICVHSGFHLGKSRDQRNWGGIVILCHYYRLDGSIYRFFSLYGHLRPTLLASVGSICNPRDVIGRIAEQLTPANGYWEHAHLHFAILGNPAQYSGGVLPGYITPEYPYRKNDWINPNVFFRNPFERLQACK